MPSGTPNVTRKRVAYNESSSNTEASSRENKKKLLDELLADQQGVLDEQLTPPLLSFIYGNTSDLYWNMLWYMPLGMVLLNGYVVRMTLEVDDGVDLLQKAKYKYKGA
ncbi:hypothetical protein HK098_000757 [Nowakowskiella sp. JEL0407]|nr:hypothetical protein HK098_000757 [Nowakowskiella sp. JEL0407]